MKALRVGDDFFINADSVEVVQRFGTRPATREAKRARDAGTLHNTTRGSTARSLITLKSGWVVISTCAPETLVSRPLIVPPTRPSARFAGANPDDDFLNELEDRLRGSK